MNEDIQTVESSPQTTLPLCVDLDGTLIQTDLLLESLVRVLKQSPWLMFMLPIWLFKGKNYLKSQLAHRARIEIAVLPWNHDLLNWLSEEKTSGRRLILVTGSHIHLAQQVAIEHPLFEEVLATDDQTNLVGRNKAARLVERFGVRGFDYIGNEKADLHIWKQARKAIVVSAAASVEKAVAALPETELERTFSSPPMRLKEWLKAVRLHQWMKNLLVLLPLLTAHRFMEWEAVVNALIAFLAFGLCASATYLFNDLCDLDADRAHRSKHRRALASGRLRIDKAVLLMLILGVCDLALLLLLPVGFAVMLLVYLISTLLYSFWLKSHAMIDVVTLAGLFTVRVIAGGEAIGVELSFWLMAFSIFIFLSLALVKRVSELLNLVHLPGEKSAKGRGYQVIDIPILKGMGSSSGFLAVLVYALYIHSDEVMRLYSEPRLLWLTCPLLLYWIGHMWLVTGRVEMNEDPIVYAIKDWRSWVVGAMVLVITLLATLI
jgi:4-hydroxybenzoate polyprenyltransferase